MRLQGRLSCRLVAGSQQRAGIARQRPLKGTGGEVPKSRFRAAAAASARGRSAVAKSLRGGARAGSRSKAKEARLRRGEASGRSADSTCTCYRDRTTGNISLVLARNICQGREGALCGEGLCTSSKHRQRLQEPSYPAGHSRSGGPDGHPWRWMS